MSNTNVSVGVPNTFHGGQFGRHVDVLRGIAALSVVFAHGDHSDLLLVPWIAQNKELFGSFGVKLFFMLSGYLIWTSSAKTVLDGPSRKSGLLVYCIHRATRIAPLYYANLLFCIYLLTSVGSTFVPDVNADTVWRHLTFTQDLSPSVSRALNPVLWTLTHEILYYVLVPGLMLIFGRKAIYPLLLGAIAGVIGILNLPESLVPFFQVLWLFAIGAVASLAPKGGWLSPAALAALLLCLIYAFMRGIDSQALAGLAALTFFLTLGVNRCSDWLHKARIVSTPFVWAGVVSFSIYIWHYLVLNIIAWHSDAIGGLLGSIWQSAVFRGVGTLVVILLVSVASYFVFERPAMGTIRTFLIGALVRTRSGQAA